MKLDMNELVILSNLSDEALDKLSWSAFENRENAWRELSKHYNDENHPPCCPEWDAKLAACNMNYKFWKAAQEVIEEEFERRNPDAAQDGY